MVVRGLRGQLGVEGGSLDPGSDPCSFVVVAAFEVFTLNVPSAVVRARQLDAVLVHTPADASFASARWFALWPREQSYSLVCKVAKL